MLSLLLSEPCPSSIGLGQRGRSSSARSQAVYEISSEHLREDEGATTHVSLNDLIPAVFAEEPVLVDEFHANP